MATTAQPIRLKADLKCLVCGHVAAEVEGIYGRPVKLTRVTPIGEPHWEVTPGEPLRCPRCEGRLHLDDVETIRERTLRQPAKVERRISALRRAS